MKKIKETTPANENLKSINLTQFKDKLDKVELKVKNQKATIYNYPENWDKAKINSEEGKKFRNRLRTKLKTFANNIFFYAKGDDREKLQNEVASFNAFYKTNFRLNDYSVISLTNSEKREHDIELMVSIVKECMK